MKCNIQESTVLVIFPHECSDFIFKPRHFLTWDSMFFMIMWDSLAWFDVPIIAAPLRCTIRERKTGRWVTTRASHSAKRNVLVKESAEAVCLTTPDRVWWRRLSGHLGQIILAKQLSVHSLVCFDHIKAAQMWNMKNMQMPNIFTRYSIFCGISTPLIPWINDMKRKRKEPVDPGHSGVLYLRINSSWVKSSYRLEHHYSCCLTSQQPLSKDLKMQWSACQSELRAKWGRADGHCFKSLTRMTLSPPQLCPTAHRTSIFLLAVSAAGLNSRDPMPEPQPGALWGLFITPTMHYKL